MKQKKSISAPKIGMNRDTEISQLKNTDYTFLLNGNITNEVEGYSVQNEPSNQYGVNFPSNYKVIGFKQDILSEKTYYFLTNPTTKKSSFGYVENKVIEVFNEDEEQECPDCNYSNILGEALENTTQTPVLTYVELFNDDCHIDLGNEGLNLDVNFPIKKIEIKQEKLGTTLYWNDFRNPKRYLNVTNILENPNGHYLLTQEVPCDDNEIVDCILVDKLLVFPKHNRLKIDAETIQIGGNLKMGTYEFYVTYCDLLGNEMVNYATPTNPISIFDENNNILSQTTTDAFTNFAIKLKINNLDSESFKYYKVVCVERNTVDNSQSAFVAGIYPTTDDTVVYTHSGSSSDDNITVGNVSIKRRIDLNALNLVRPTYEKAKGTMVSGDRMFDYGLQRKEEINLQPVVNLFSGLVEWQTSAAKEDLYKSFVATSKYKGYRRDEVQPYAIRFYTKDGDYTANFPFVGRPATSSDLEVISDINYQSINANTPACGVNSRNKRWQIFNTASITESCSEIESGNTIEEIVNKTCIIENVEEVPANTVTIEIEDIFDSLPQYLEDNLDIDIDGLTEYLEADYPDHCSPIFGDTCDSPILTSSYNEINLILSEVTEFIVGEEYYIQVLELGDDFSNIGFISENEVFTATGFTPTTWSNGTVVYKTSESTVFIEKDITDYQKAVSPSVCSLYVRDSSTGEYVRDTDFEDSFMNCDGSSRQKVYLRDSSFSNEKCSLAETISDNSSYGNSYFLNYGGDVVLANLLTTYDVEPSTVTANFQNKLHKKALFFKGLKSGRDKLVLEITPNSRCQSDADNLENLNLLRYTIYDSCSSLNVLGGGIINTNNGLLLEIDVTTFPNSFIVAIDAPIKTENIDDVCPPIIGSTSKFKILPPCGCFSIFTRDIEYKQVEVSWDKILLNKIENYQSTCLFSIPVVDECDPKPYVKGIPAYWESTETYPDNKELYDSSTLKIKPVDLENLPTDKREQFKSYFTQNGNVNQYGNYFLKDSTDLRCSPIRHIKFPDNTLAPFMYGSESQQQFSETIIFPLGITIDSSIITTMLQVAKNNGLISQKQLDSIDGYEILRGDNTVHKSVIANGLGFDMYNYEKEDGEKWWYSNFPFNDLGDDKFHTSDSARKNLIKHPYNGDGNYLYSFLSPDIFLTKPALPTEVSLSGYQFGNSVQSIVDVKDHPKYTILGSDARRLADTLSVLEAAFEAAVAIAQAGENYRFGFGLANSANPVGIGLSIAAAVASVASQALRVGQYRYEWLKTFRDLGTTHNFVTMNVGVGTYNRFVKEDSDSINYLRGLTVKKYLKDGLYNTVDNSNSDKININNWLREESVLISTGVNYKYTYPTEYKSRDNNKIGAFSGSKMLASDIDCKTNQDFIRNIASPYFTLKNYIPDQWGTVDSIQWLTTNYSFKLTDSNDCSPILGGTVCISPFSWRRKTPLFRENAMSQPSKTPFSYSEYNNIGYTKYYLDYETGDTHKILGVSFPDISNDYNFDCLTGNRSFYVKPPSKMYLYSYGIVNFLVESEINGHFRYAGKEQKDGFYPQISNVAEWVQEKNMSISQPNTFYYNSSYSLPVTRSPYKFLDYTYNKEVWQKRNYQPNALIYSEIDNNENSLTDPWLVYKPLNFYEFSSKFGELIDLKDIESSQFLARFENQLVLHNAIDNLADRITPQNKEIGTGGIFATRPIEFKTTDLGFLGTQVTDICSTPYGHFYVDNKRGRIFQIDQNGTKPEAISEQIGNQPSNMKQWFREHLPFKILKTFPNIDIDNKFKGLGMNIWYDDRNNRVFFTKRDYIAKTTDCLKYDDEIGFYTDCEDEVQTCPEGYTYNSETGKCEYTFQVPNLCPDGYIYNELEKTCTLIETIEPLCCTEDATVIASPSSLTISEGETAIINLSGTTEGTTFTWTVVNSGTSGAVDGSGNTISQVITGSGTTTYTITPNYNGCIGESINVVVTVDAVVISNTTKINIWFDSSGSMNTTLTPLQEMVTTILKPCLLPFYNNDSDLYDSRVTITNFADERYINYLATTSVDTEITKVINLAFADESNTYGAEATYSGTITPTASGDIATLRTTLETEPTNSLFGIVFQVATGGVGLETYPGFKTFVTNVHNGIAPFTGTDGLSDKPQVGYELDVVPASTATYYANLIINALNNLGFTIDPC